MIFENEAIFVGLARSNCIACLYSSHRQVDVVHKLCREEKSITPVSIMLMISIAFYDIFCDNTLNCATSNIDRI